MCHSSFSELFSQVLLADFLRYFLVAGAAYLVFWVIFFKKWRHRIIQRKNQIVLDLLARGATTPAATWSKWLLTEWFPNHRAELGL